MTNIPSKNNPEKQEKSLKEQYIESQKNAFFREVEEEVKAEKVAIIWNKYKRYIISVITIILVSTIAYNWYKEYKTSTSKEQAKQFERIISAPNVSAEGKILELQQFANSAKFGYKDIAYFNIYSLQIESQKYDDAIKTLETIIDNATDKSFKNLAILKLAAITSSLPEENYEKTIKLLKKIGSNQPFYPMAQFILGSIYVKQNDFEKAEKIFSKITDDNNTPVSIKSQSLTILNFIKSSKAK